MSDNNNDQPRRLTLGKKTDTSSGPKKVVRQNITQGRSKNVTVEVKKKRFHKPHDGDVPNKTGLTQEEIQSRVSALKELKVKESRELAAREIKAKESIQKQVPPASSPVPGVSKVSKNPQQVIKPKKPFEEKPFEEPKKKGTVDEKRKSGKKIQAFQYGNVDELEEILEEKTRIRKIKKKIKEKPQQHRIVRDVIIPDHITVGELANRMAVRASDVIKLLLKQGVVATLNQTLDHDIAQYVCEEYGHSAIRVSEDDVENLIVNTESNPENLVPRAPVVTVMGHVDHGKTSLLDAIRKTEVVSGEAGGITQHIGAYRVKSPSGKYIVFVDTPGHEAFSEMRARGAKLTDMVVLVVAADDGIKEQTVEAIHHAKAAEVPIIVAINKIDKPDANPERVYNELLKYELVAERMGGETLVVEVSARTGQNLDKLEEAILLQAEVMDLKADPTIPAEGIVVEAALEKGRGPVATILIQQGILKIGDIVVAGAEYGRVKAMTNDKAEKIDTAAISMPAQVLGLSGVPQAGDKMNVVPDESTAVRITERRREKIKQEQQKVEPKTLSEMLQSKAGSQKKTLAVILKGDVQGSVEAIKGSLDKLISDKIELRVLHTGVGPITEGDVSLARASNAIIIAFNVRANAQAKELASNESVIILYHSIIYRLIDEIKQVMTGMLGSVKRDKFIGYAEVRQVFNVTKVGRVAGCMVTEGSVQRGAKVRLLRDNVVIHEGKLKSLKRFKDEVKEVQKGYECGIAFENYDDIKVSDMIECSIEEDVQQVL